MNTRILKSDNLKPAIDTLKNGLPVAIPTETVYGLAANALDPQACSKIFQVKGRPLDNPLIVHISSLEMLKMVVKTDSNGEPIIPPPLVPIIQKFWPGPLTLILPKGDSISPVICAGLDTIAIRFPSHPIALKIIEECGFPLAAPSANKSGRPSPTTASHVMTDLKDCIDYIVDGGSSSEGLESTVLDVIHTPPTILRPGTITLNQLRPFIPNLEIYQNPLIGDKNKGKDDDDENEINDDEMDSSSSFRPISPGMKYRHYSPNAPVILFRNKEGIEEYIDDKIKSGNSIVRLFNQNSNNHSSLNVKNIIMSQDGNVLEIARNLFAALRDADALNPDFIIAEYIDGDDEELAIMNRLSKAASEII